MAQVTRVIKGICKTVKARGVRFSLYRLYTLIRFKLISPKMQLKPLGKPLDFPYFETPDVSIIIPVHNKYLYTYNCLKSILVHSKENTYEVIVVDDASSDNTPQALEDFGNIKVLRNNENLGFVASCNSGASVARGKYLHFLNNDVIVCKRWLDPLVQAFEEDAALGAAGSKLLYPNLILQEAGSYIWQDGRASNYGKFDKANKPDYCIRREVDYCSAASLMIRKGLFHKIGGFDMRYAPAYWEDVDLCFSVRKQGFKVVYLPDSQVIHFEGVSAGTELTPGMKRYQESNKSKFIDKWAAVLVNHPRNMMERMKKGEV